MRGCSTLSACGDDVLPHVAVFLPRAFVKALIEPRELSQRPKAFNMCLCQLERLRGTRPLVAALENLSEGCSIERAGPVLALVIEDVQHAARLVQEGHQLDAAGVKDPEGLQTEVFSLTTLFTANSSFLLKRQQHRECMKGLNDRVTLI